jgi:hypothetical protein
VTDLRRDARAAAARLLSDPAADVGAAILALVRAEVRRREDADDEARILFGDPDAKGAPMGILPANAEVTA